MNSGVPACYQLEPARAGGLRTRSSRFGSEVHGVRGHVLRCTPGTVHENDLDDEEELLESGPEEELPEDDELDDLDDEDDVEDWGDDEDEDDELDDDEDLDDEEPDWDEDEFDDEEVIEDDLLAENDLMED